MNARHSTRTTLLALIAICLMLSTASAAPPHPDMFNETVLGKRSVPYFISNQEALRKEGINSGINEYELGGPSAKLPSGAIGAVTGEFNILAILVRFADKNSSTAAGYFDDLLFDELDVSLRHYYRDASYGQLDIVTVDLPSSVGWTTAPQLYSYYVNNENGVNPASYPRNAQGLVEDLVTALDGSVDFSRYDNDDNGFVDVLMVIHAGQGAELSGADTDMWSHQWSIYPKLTGDGVYVSSYTMQPEYLVSPGDMTIGVYAHELGHAFGLPDLYDTDYSSNGIGSWGIMAYGSWLGPHGMGGLPAHPCAWSRIQMGFANATQVSSNINNQEIGDVKSTGDIFRLWTSGNAGDEYFLVENRQQTGYDVHLPASGMLIWHIDEAMSDNDDEWFPGLNPSNHYLVALEQSDGLYELELATDMGDANDAFPGSTDSFNGLSSTSSDSYSDGASLVAVENISSPSETMLADFRVSLLGGIDEGEDDDDGSGEEVLPEALTLSQNYPNPFNPTTTISFYTPEPGPATVKVYNILGRPVRTLYSGQASSGYTEVVWDGTNGSGSPVASGIYLYMLELNGQRQTKKMSLVR